MKKKLLHTPEGVRDIYGIECEKKRLLQDKLHRMFQIYGYEDIETPMFEFFDVFGKETGTVPSKELYKFFDRDGNTLSLRPDFTPSIARAAAKYFIEENMPVRLCYTGNAFINHSSYQGRLKETTQIGAELIGDNSVQADAEMVAMVVEALMRSGLTDFQVSIGQVEFFKGLIEEAGIEEETEEQLKDLIANKNNFAMETILEEIPMPKALKEVFLKLPELYGSIERIREVKTLTNNTRALEAIERLEKLHEVLTVYGYEQQVTFDLGMLSRYQYYTGIIFRAYTFGTGDAIVKGGRYNKLLGTFGKDTPSTGFVIMSDELLLALSRQKIEFPELGQEKPIMVLYRETYQEDAIRYAVSLRRKNVCVKLCLLEEERTSAEYEEYAKQKACELLYLFEDGNGAKKIEW